MSDRYMVDSNVLIYLSNSASPFRVLTATAVSKLRSLGLELCVCPQSIIELRSVLTRPLSSPNGIGMPTTDADAEVADHLNSFTLISDSAAVFDSWKSLVEGIGVRGKQNHDARMMAAASAGGCTHLLTFNDSDFMRYTALSSVTTVNPTSI